MHTVSVQLGSRSYSIKIAPGLLGQIGRECARLNLGGRCAIITDSNVGRRLPKLCLMPWRTPVFHRC